MYTTVRDRGPAGGLNSGTTPKNRWAAVSRNVVLLGLTSLFTDVSSEMLTAVLPLYFVMELRMTPLQFGLIDGIYQGTSALVRVASGLVADAGRRYKTVATFGYVVSALCKAGLLFVSGGMWAAFASLLMIDRLGKGVRTAPRDAIITFSSDPTRLGEAFGVHRAMDTVGAVAGPIIAFAVLARAPAAYDSIFVISLAFAVIGVAIIALFVDNVRAPDAPPQSSARPSRALFAAVLADSRYRALVFAGGMLGALTASDALIFLLLQRKSDLPATFFPLLFVGMSSVYLLLAMPFGRLADVVGRHRMFLAGHLLIAILYVVLLQSELSTVGVALSVALLGGYYAATDGVLSALASTVLSTERLTTGLALVSTVAAIARLVAAALFGALWSWLGPFEAVLMLGVGMLAAALVSARLLRVREAWFVTPTTS